MLLERASLHCNHTPTQSVLAPDVTYLAFRTHCELLSPMEMGEMVRLLLEVKKVEETLMSVEVRKGFVKIEGT